MKSPSLGLGAVGLGFVLATSITGCPSKDAVLEPLAEVPPSCLSDADCVGDDGNACTKNTCDTQTFLCVVTLLDGVPTPMAALGECLEHVCRNGADTAVPVESGVAIATQMAGDCKKVTCDGMGGEIEINDDTDVKNDGLECTLDVCLNGVPMNSNAPADTPCGANMDLVCNGEGQCLGCLVGADCSANTTACGSSKCVNGACDVMFEPKGTQLPAGDQTAENCKMRVCDGAGNVIDIADAGDPPNDGNECTADACNGMIPAHTPAPAGLACNGDGVCDDAGNCRAPLGKACAADNECASVHCVDGVCCDTTCTGSCMACNAMGSIGTCSHIPFPGTDTTCSGTQVCNGTGSCELANGQTCNNGAKKCASGTCYQGKCKSTTGQPCAMNSDCVTGMCVNATCG